MRNNVDIWEYIKYERISDYFAPQACLSAEARFLWFFMWASYRDTKIPVQRLHIIADPYVLNPQCVQKNVGNDTYLCLEGPFAGTIVTPHVFGEHMLPLRALYNHPIDRSMDHLINSLQPPPLPEHLQGFDETEQFLPLLIGLLTHLRLPVEQSIFQKNVETFSAMTTEEYVRLAEKRKKMT